MNLMKRSVVLCLLFALVLSCKEAPKPVADNRLNDYALTDENGNFHRLSHYNDSKAIVLWVQGNGCPIVRNLVTDFNNIVSEYSSKGFTFFLLNCNSQDDREETKKEAEEFNFAAPVLRDQVQLLADRYDIKITSEAIVLHPVTREILYRGPVNDRLDYEAQKNEAKETYLRDALDAILLGNAVRSKEEMTRGCTVTRLSKNPEEENLTYINEIAPILADHCIRCHNPGGIAPWAMTDYETVKGWSSMMKQVLLSKRMPPWNADIEVNSFLNTAHLADSNRRKIIRWIDNGLVRGEGKDTLTTIKLDNEAWQAGTPDVIISLKKEEIPATGLIDYRFQDVPLNFTEDTWLRGVEIKPGNSKVLHHLILTNRERKEKSPITLRNPGPWTDNFIALCAGNDQLTMYPKGTGVFIPAGTTLTVQIHYTPTGKPEEDTTRIGLYTLENPPAREFGALTPSNTEFEIPAYAKNVRLTASDSIVSDMKIHYIIPHMHYRGKSFKMYVRTPEGDTKTIISVPEFNFNWQWLYQLEEPYFIKKGSVLIAEGIYDNSHQNPLNPDPSKDLIFGIQSTDEMLLGMFNYTIED